MQDRPSNAHPARPNGGGVATEQRTVTNNTKDKLTVEWIGHAVGRVESGDTQDVELGTRQSGCAAGGVTAGFEDGQLVATMPAPICEGDTWVIEESDLVPAPTTATPTPAAATG